jgi:16S rRNA (adenine1518-N6/adenine1519-N6)-dimethyltransferase
MMRLYKKIGQHFLREASIAKKEVEYANLSNKDIVLEIGPGNGILTKLLANKAKKVIAIEIDSRLVKELKDVLPENVMLIHGDALKIDFRDLPRFNKVVSNLPFNISSTSLHPIVI